LNHLQAEYGFHSRKETVSVLEPCTFRLSGNQCSGKQVIISCELLCLEIYIYIKKKNVIPCEC